MKVLNGVAHYSSFAEVAAAMNIKPVTKVTKDKEKLNSQREKFCNRHLCRTCNQPMVFVGSTNTMVCQNVKCPGIKQTRTDKEGNEIVYYTPSFDVLDETGAEIALNIF